MKKSEEIQILVNNFAKVIVERNSGLSRSRKSYQEHELFLDDQLRMVFLLTEELNKHISILESQLEESV